MARKIGRDQVGEAPHRRQRPVDGLSLERQARIGLTCEHLIPSRRLRVEGEDLPSVVGEAGDDLWIERVPRPLTDDAYGVLLASQQTLEGRVDGDEGDAHRQRDPVTHRTAEQALAIPALEQVGEETLHRRGKADAIGKYLRHLANGGELAGARSAPSSAAGVPFEARAPPLRSREEEARERARSGFRVSTRT
jgi:hypothetical protein